MSDSKHDTAKETLDRVDDPEDIRHVTEAIEDGRYAAKCVRARVEGKPLPVRRPPCFFNFSAFAKMLEGHQLADFVAVLGSLNIIAAELDR